MSPSTTAAATWKRPLAGDLTIAGSGATPVVPPASSTEVDLESTIAAPLPPPAPTPAAAPSAIEATLPASGEATLPADLARPVEASPFGEVTQPVGTASSVEQTSATGAMSFGGKTLSDGGTETVTGVVGNGTGAGAATVSVPAATVNYREAEPDATQPATGVVPGDGGLEAA